MSPQYLSHDGAAPSPTRAPSARLRAAKWPVLGRRTRTGAACALVGLASSMMVAPTQASVVPSGMGPFAPGSVVVSQGGTIFGGVGSGNSVEANGEVDVYSPDANGDVSPEATFTNGMYAPVSMAFDPSGDLWVGNVNTLDLFEITRAQLGTPNPVPQVTIFAPSGLFSSPSGMVFDRSGNLWVVGPGGVYEYTKSQLAVTGAPAPHTTIPAGVFPGPRSLLGDVFDPSGDLWVTTGRRLVEFSKAELAKAKPLPTVTISSTGGADPVFTPSGNLWMVTGGGPKGDCFGTPCTNEVVEFTKAQLARSGSPTPAVTISSTKAGAAGSRWGPYGVAVDPSGDLWVANFFKPTTVEYGKDQLSTSGSPTPVRTIAGPRTGMNWPSYVVTVP